MTRAANGPIVRAEIHDALTACGLDPVTEGAMDGVIALAGAGTHSYSDGAQVATEAINRYSLREATTQDDKTTALAEADGEALTPQEWLAATGWNARTLRQYPEKALKVMSEQVVRADGLQASLSEAVARGDQAAHDAEDQARDATFEREGRRKAEKRITDALLVGTRLGSVKADIMHALRPYADPNGEQVADHV